jgi:hypothetical protein
MSARLLVLAALVVLATSAGCFLTVPVVVGEHQKCDESHACLHGLTCVSAGSTCEHVGEGEGEGGEGEGEGGEGEGEGGEGEGEGAGEGEGEGGGCPTPCDAATQICIDSSCVTRVAPSIAGLQVLLKDNVTRSFTVPATATQAAPFVLDVDHDESVASGFAGTAEQSGTFPDVAVYLFHDVDIAGYLKLKGTRAVAIVGLSSLTVESTGVIDVSGGDGVSLGSGTTSGGPGALIGSGGLSADSATVGGANALAGGGNAIGPGPAAVGNAQIVPLEGGGPGADNAGLGGGGGGGAVLLFSETSVVVNGKIDAHGGGGGGGPEATPTSTEIGTGGGAGGSILLEAPSVIAGAQLVINGGGGCSDDGTHDATRLHGGCASCAQLPPGNTQPCGDGAPGRVRINTRGTFVAPPVPDNCLATISFGTARLATEPPPQPTPPTPVTTVPALAAPVDVASSHSGSLPSSTAMGAFVAVDDQNHVAIEAGGGAAAGVRFLQLNGAGTVDDGNIVQPTSVDIDGLAGANAFAIAGDAAAGTAVAYQVLMTPFGASPTPLANTGFNQWGSAVAVRHGNVQPLFLVGHGGGVHVFTLPTTGGIVDAGELDFSAATTPVGAVKLLAMKGNVAVVVGFGGGYLFSVSATAVDATGFTLTTTTPIPISNVSAAATDGHLVVLGSPGDPGCAADAGSVTVIDLDAGSDGAELTTGLAQPLSSPGTVLNGNFGAFVATKDHRIAVSAPGEGAVYGFFFDPVLGPIAAGEVTAASGLFQSVGLDVSATNQNGIAIIGEPTSHTGVGGLVSAALGF